jgi:alpha-D-ribose 1-methylphosphonate 5-triphosphate synthase subunit PhnH
MTVAQLAVGLVDPVMDAQRVFRAALEAFAHPGRIVSIPALPPAPAPLHAAATAFVLALADYETPLWLDATADQAPVRDYLRFYCGAPLVASPAVAHFALVADAAALPPLGSFAQGDAAYPERSATIVVQVAGFENGPPVRLHGPGIAGETTLRIAGLAERFWPDWAANHAAFPLGVDVVLAAPRAVVALPRTIAAEVGPCTSR